MGGVSFYMEGWGFTNTFSSNLNTVNLNIFLTMVDINLKIKS